jgi:phage repressor protein C with HTH and peptisase S24 domain
MDLSASSDEVRALAERITDAVKASGGASFVARAASIPLRTLGKYMKGDASPSALALSKIAGATSRTLDWFTASIAPFDAQKALSDDSVAHIPILDVRAAAGAGATNGDEQVLAYLPFPREFLRALGVKPDRVRALHAYGDSMEPTIPDGRLVLVDLGDRDISRPRVFVLRTPDGLRLKRVQRLVDGSIRLLSDNKELYPPEMIAGADINGIKVIGRAIWTERLL